MAKQTVEVMIKGPTASGKTTLVAVLTWALRKFNYTLDYKGTDRQKWMQLSGDEVELSYRMADMFKKDAFPIVEVSEEVADKDTLVAQLRAEVQVVQAQLKTVLDEKLALEEQLADLAAAKDDRHLKDTL